MNRILAALAAIAAFASPARAETVVKFGFCARTITSAAAPFAVAMKMGWYPPDMKVQLVPVAIPRPRSLDAMGAPEFSEAVRRIRAHFNAKSRIEE